jgi:hypothetical protein
MSRHTKSPSTSNAAARRPASAVGAISTQSMTAPTYEQIAARAYEIFIARGGEHGRDQEDWYQAEGELRLGQQ